jgi:hypothetical protein
MAALLREPPVVGDEDEDAPQRDEFLRLVRNFTRRVEHGKDEGGEPIRRRRKAGVPAVPTISLPVAFPGGDSLSGSPSFSSLLEEVRGYRADLRASEGKMLEAIQHLEESTMGELREVTRFISRFIKTEEKLVQMVGDLKREKRRSVVEDEGDE